MKKFSFIILYLLFSTNIIAQNTWKKINLKRTSFRSSNVHKNRHPKKYDLYSLSVDDFKSQLKKVDENTKKIIEFPSGIGKTERFEIYEASCFQEGLAKKFPNIKSYNIIGIDDKSATGKLSVGADGVHVMISSPNFNTLYIDPHTKDNKTYIAYKRNSLPDNKFTCNIEEKIDHITNEPSTANRRAGGDDVKLKTYRLAIGCTAEYSQFHINKYTGPSTSDKNKVLSAINTTITRVNQIYERDLGIHLQLVNDTEKIIFLINPMVTYIPDPKYPNQTETTRLMNHDEKINGFLVIASDVLIGQSQAICEKYIKSPNYDIGHTFSTGGGGIAAVGGVCDPKFKGRGITGSSEPKGDAYNVDFVCHEIGHQFGAHHTFNNNSRGGCNGNRANFKYKSSVEPGSGTTIMAYAGICSGVNVQMNSDDYFHAVSINQIKKRQEPNSCPVKTKSDNHCPTANAGKDYTVPTLTPLNLKGKGVDQEDNNLTYCWEQIDIGSASAPLQTTYTKGPVFRSLKPKTVSNRYLPALETVISGQTESDWEVIPSVAREMNFSLTIRDNHSGVGGTARDDMKITFVQSTPFKITSQSSNETWLTGTTKNITWDKGETKNNPINCKYVNIKLSIDGGQTFPITLKEKAPNNGSYNITVPDNITSTARIMVEANDNIFYNVNKTNFKIKKNNTEVLLTAKEATKSICANKKNNIEFNMDFTLNTSGTFNFSVENLPNGVSSSFSPPSLSSSGTVKLTLNNINNLIPSINNINVIARSSSLEEITPVTLNVNHSELSKPTLNFPENSSLNISIGTYFKWDGVPNADNYIFEIAKGNDFKNIIETINTSNNFCETTKSLENKTKYYWRVKSKNECTEGDYSSTHTFTTNNISSYCECVYDYTGTDDEYISNFSFKDINNPSGNATNGYEDFTDKSTKISRGINYSANISIMVPQAQSKVVLFIDWNQDFIFSEEETYVIGTYLGHTEITEAIQDINVPTNAKLGKTRIRVMIEYAEDFDNKKIGSCTENHPHSYGEAEDYTLIIEKQLNEGTNEDEADSSSENVIFNNIKLGPNPTEDGNIYIKFDNPNSKPVTMSLFDIKGRLIEKREFKNLTTIFEKRVKFNVVRSAIYILQLKGDEEVTSKKIIFK